MIAIELPNYPNYGISRCGKVLRIAHGKRLISGVPYEIKQHDSHGYSKVVLYCNGKCINRFVHVLVLEAWVGPRPKGMQASHLDGNRKNNTAENLIWEYPKENHARKLVHGTALLGSRHWRTKLTEADIPTIRQLLATGKYTFYEIGRMYNIEDSAIRHIAKGNTWQHVA
jgi:hypothetical protein